MNTHRVLRIPLVELVIVASVLFTIAGLALLISLAWPMIHIPSDPSPIQADPLELVNAFHSAINNDNVDTMLALLTEDATVTDSGSMIQGKEEIRKWALHSQRMVGLRLRLIHSQVTDEKVFWYDVAHNGPEIQDRVYLLRWTAILQNGKIKSLTVSLVPMPDGK